MSTNPISKLPVHIFRHMESEPAAIALWVVLNIPPESGINTPDVIESKLIAIRENDPRADMRRAAAMLLPGETDDVAVQLVAAISAEERNRLERIIETRVWFKRWMDMARIYKTMDERSDEYATRTLNRIVASKLDTLAELLALVAREDEVLQVAKDTLKMVVEMEGQN
ncbi:hypothetical protein CC2G_014264 [Coprinopsis cinerea AmutBmut pab1-1]|nr:hypothetical protein CC2G_014264 [Coprinopsis cinerea AmutBmut pab1-1]